MSIIIAVDVAARCSEGGGRRQTVALEPHSNACSLCATLRWTRFAVRVQTCVIRLPRACASASDASEDVHVLIVGDKRPQTVSPLAPARPELKELNLHKSFSRNTCARLNVRSVACVSRKKKLSSRLGVGEFYRFFFARPTRFLFYVIFALLFLLLFFSNFRST